MSFDISYGTDVKAGLLVRRPNKSCQIFSTRLSNTWSVVIHNRACGVDGGSDSIVVLDGVTTVDTIIKAEAPTVKGRKAHARHGHGTIEC